jgi:hypothetical protein
MFQKNIDENFSIQKISIEVREGFLKTLFCIDIDLIKHLPLFAKEK